MLKITSPVYSVAARTWPALPLVPCYPYSDQPLSLSKLAVHPSQEDRQFWLKNYAHYNAGLALGAISDLTLVVCGQHDGQSLNALLSVLPPTPAAFSVGGQRHLLYRHSPTKAFTLLEDDSSRELVQLRNDGEVMLVSPSHLSTTSGPMPMLSPQLFSHDDLPVLPDDIEALLRSVLLSEGFVLRSKSLGKSRSKMPVGQRDIKVRAITSLVCDQILSGTLNLRDGAARINATHQDWQPDYPMSHYLDMLYRWGEEDLERTRASLPMNWDQGLSDQQKSELGLTWGDHLQEWSYAAIRDFAYKGFTKHYDDDNGRASILDQALFQLARAQSLTEVEQDLLKQFLARQSRLGVKLAGLNRQLKELAQQRFTGGHHTDIAQDMLRRLTRIHEYRYSSYRFYRYNGSHWEFVTYGWLRRYISEHYGHLRGAKKEFDQKGILQIVRHALDKPINEHSTCGINFANGYLSENLEVFPHTPNRGMIYTLPFEYHAAKAGKMPMFESFLHDCWGQDEDFEHKKMALQEALAATLFGVAPRYQRAFLLYGVPSSGKTQLLNIISAMVPSNTKTSVPPNEWNQQFKPAMLHHKLLNVCGELSETRFIDGQTFKDIIDGTERTGEIKRLQPFQFRPKAAHWFASNHLPRTRDTSEGFTRRWLILSFNRPITEGHKLIRDLGHKIVAAEQEAIMAWACQAMPRLLRHNDYTLPASHYDHLEDMADMANPLRFFVNGSGWVNLHNSTTQVSSLSTDEKNQLCQTLPHVSGDMLLATFSRYASERGNAQAALLKKFHLAMAELCPTLGVLQRRVKYTSGKTDFVYFGMTVNSPSQRFKQQKEDGDSAKALILQARQQHMREIRKKRGKNKDKA